MKDIFHDSNFQAFLSKDGGIADLDEDIGPLIYTLFKLDFIQTYWSCSGHIGDSLMDVGYSSDKNCYVYHCGYLFFTMTKNSSSAQNFLQELAQLINNYSFASLKHKNTNEYQIFLEMQDLVDSQKIKQYNEEQEQKKQEKSIFDILSTRPEPRKDCEIKKSIAKKRYKQFVEFWNQLNTIAKKYIN